jgi:hypothetical protein
MEPDPAIHDPSPRAFHSAAVTTGLRTGAGSQSLESFLASRPGGEAGPVVVAAAGRVPRVSEIVHASTEPVARALSHFMSLRIAPVYTQRARVREAVRASAPSVVDGPYVAQYAALRAIIDGVAGSPRKEWRPMSVMTTAPILGPAAWRAEDLALDTDWIRPITDAEVEELDTALRLGSVAALIGPR